MQMLGWVERNYGSVAEYNRCMEEADELEYERECKRHESYRKNKEKLDKAQEEGLKVVYFADDCVGCKHYEDVSMMCEDDDVTHGICRYCGKCPRLK